VTKTADVPVIRLHPLDNVVVASRRLSPGARAAREGLDAREAIPVGHKMATRFIAAGDPILKYGLVIGAATLDILAGSHVHSHNMAMTEERRRAEVTAWSTP
jgi:altronate hydrolase